MANVFDYIFNIGGNYSATIEGMSAATGEFQAKVNGAQSCISKLGSVLATIDLVKNAIDGLNQATETFSVSGIKLDSQMHDLSAVAGVTGETLQQIEGFARDSAKAFGTDASVAVEGYKLLLSQLSPELGKYPEVLRSMGDNIQTTAKLMGGDGVAAAQVLTTAMNQYGVSLDDPVAASQEMARMMNVMAASGQAGSAELPAISAALQQCGMAAKAAGVSFEETNAAIQVLDKAGKKASEGGVALRNVLGQLSKGRFVDKQSAEELAKAGIDVTALGDNSLSLKQRLDLLKPMLNDSALLSKFFGVENANAARALIAGTDALQGYTEAVTGTDSATEQAAIVMDSYAERQARVNQRIEDFKISAFQATGDLTLWAGAIMGVMTPLAQVSPLILGVGKSMMWFAGIASTGFAAFKVSAVTACRAVSTAIFSIPIVGWVALAVAAIAALGVYFWNTSVKFRAVLKGLWAAFKAVFTGIKDMAKQYFGAIGDLLRAAFTLDAAGIGAALKKLGGSYANYGKQIGKAFKGAYDAELKAGEQDGAKNGKKGRKAASAVEATDAAGFDAAALAVPAALAAGATTDVTAGSLSNPTLSGSSAADGGSKIKNVTINIDRLVEHFTISTQNLSESSERVKEAVLDALMGALNDTQLAID